MSFLLGTLVYVAISPERITARDVRSGKSFSDVPELALLTSPKSRILGIGSEARAHQSEAAVRIVNPFAHPRSLISDFTLAEQLLRLAIRRIVATSIFTPAPKMILHPLGAPEGGFTQVERRALRELGFGAGARQVDVLEGREPSDQELLNWTFGNRN
jgi:rod shape-determining protein MreB